ncbi:unnamed protein product [Lepidochelys kempii]
MPFAFTSSQLLEPAGQEDSFSLPASPLPDPSYCRAGSDTERSVRMAGDDNQGAAATLHLLLREQCLSGRTGGRKAEPCLEGHMRANGTKRHLISSLLPRSTVPASSQLLKVPRRGMGGEGN